MRWGNLFFGSLEPHPELTNASGMRCSSYGSWGGQVLRVREDPAWEWRGDGEIR